MSLLHRFRSKRKSEYGTWVDDLQLHYCMICDVPFGFVNRKHHCRLCGITVCQGCSENTTYLDSSRSGQPKRICDWCFYLEREWDEGEETYKPSDEKDPSKPHILQQPRVKREDAVSSLREAALAGRWTAVINFHYWPIHLPGSSKALNKDGAEDLVPVKRVETNFDLGQKGVAVRGVCPSLPEVGHDGHIEGRCYPRSGKVTLELTMDREGGGPPIRLSIDGWVNSEGLLVGVILPVNRTAGGNERATTTGGRSTGDGMIDGNPLMGTFRAQPQDVPSENAVDMSDVTEEEARGGEPEDAFDMASHAGGAADRGEGSGGAAAGEGRVPYTDPAEKDRRAARAVAMPSIPREEAVEGLKRNSISGRWIFHVVFKMVDLGRDAALAAGASGGAGVHMPGRGRARGKRGGGVRSSHTSDARVRTGSQLRVPVEMTKKGASYFHGHCGSFGQFGKDGPITGSLQKGTGRVNIQIQTKHRGVTTSFNFAGYFNKDDELVGGFSGCEIARDAGSVSGTFRAWKMPADDSDDDDDDNHAPARTSSSESEQHASGGGAHKPPPPAADKPAKEEADKPAEEEAPAADKPAEEEAPAADKPAEEEAAKPAEEEEDKPAEEEAAAADKPAAGE